MRKFTSTLCTAVAVSLALLSYSPATAAPVFVPNGSANNGVIEVQTRAQIEEAQQPRYRLRRDRDFYQRGDYYYYHGHRGYRYKRPGYRYYNGWWFPAGAFIAGAIIGGALNNPPRYYHGGSAHVRWCYNRYRSYREWDNTFQPYHGPRRHCYSPYS